VSPGGRDGAGVPLRRVVREAAPAELPGWDALTVDVVGGDVQQSRAWAAHRARTGWRPHHLVLDDGSAVLALGRPWRLVGGGRLYVSKGPVTAGASAAEVAGRLGAVAAWARSAGYDVVVADAEIPAASGYGALVGRLGFRPTEEVGPSRHRMGTPLEPGSSDEAIMALFGRATRHAITAAQRRGTRVVRHDLAGAAAFEGVEASSGGRPLDAAEEAFGRFHALLAAAGARRGFAIGGRTAVLAWWRAALEAGHLLLLEARSRDEVLLGGAIFYRHGTRLSYAHAADVAELRSSHAGTAGLLLWRAFQLAAREGRTELDLGGVDVRGARREPRPGEPLHGLLDFKRSFGGRWIELAGAQQRVVRPARHALVVGTRRLAEAARALPRHLGGRSR